MRTTPIALAALLGLASSPALADQLVLEYDSIYSGSGAPANGAPFARATFASSAPGTVTLFLEGLLASSEFISGFYFNFDPTLNLSNLGVAHTAGTTPAGMTIGPDSSHTAGGGGRYDILLSFPNAAAMRFNGADTATFTFASSEAITASSFNFIGSAHGGHGPFTTAAHVQGLSNGGSVWVSGDESQEQILVPLPAGAWAGLAGLACVGLVRRRAIRR